MSAYADPAVAAVIAAGFVPIRVDADRRPDINDRYNLDGWPTTACLTSSGEILTGTTYLPADGLKTMLAEVAEAYATRRDMLDDRATRAASARRAQPRTRPAGVEPDLSAQAWVASQVVAQCDPDNGGFGADGKFLHVAALSSALAEYAQTRDAALARALTLTLDGMAGGAIHDEVDGGFFRYAAGRDWTRPHTEKMLDDQIGVAVLYLDAARILEQPRWHDVARSVIGYVRRTLTDDASLAFFASQAADDAYYQVQTGALRRTLEPPIGRSHARSPISLPGRRRPGCRLAPRSAMLRCRRPAPARSIASSPSRIVPARASRTGSTRTSASAGC